MLQVRVPLRSNAEHPWPLHPHDSNEECKPHLTAMPLSAFFSYDFILPLMCKKGDSKRVSLCVTHVDRSKDGVRLRTKRAQFLTAFGRSGFSYGKRESGMIG